MNDPIADLGNTDRNVHITPSDVHVIDGECFCTCIVLEGDNGVNIIWHDETPDDA